MLGRDSGGIHQFIRLARMRHFGDAQVAELGHGNLSFTAVERLALREHLLAGGFLLANDSYGLAETFRADAFETLLAGWKGQGYEIASVRGLAAQTNLAALPLHEVTAATQPARRGARTTQGQRFLEENPTP